MEGHLIQSIKNWIEIDTEIEGLQKKLKELKLSKKKIGLDLTDTMRTNNLDCIDVNSGQIRYVKNKVKKGINQTYLLEVMEKYHQNKEEAIKLCKYIQENRQTLETEKIQFKKDKIK